MPALQFDNGDVLTENIAILSKIADKYPALMAPGQFGRYRLLEMLAYIATEIHKAFHPLFDPGASETDKKMAGEAVAKKLSFVATKLEGPYLFGANATVADFYLFVMLESLRRAHEVTADRAGGAAARRSHQVMLDG